MTAVYLGLYLFELPSALESVERWQTRLGRPVNLLSIYQAWGSPYRDFYARELGEIHRKGWTSLITWEPWELPLPGKPPENQPAFNLQRILAGAFDDYIWRWAQSSKASSVPYLLRPMHEMNGNWYPWCGTVNRNKPEDYSEAWKYLHAIFRDAGAVEAAWVWSPYAISYPQSPENAISCYYPGDAYVDWVALDGYNWGASQPWSQWQNFEEIFSAGYYAVTRLTDKPLLIGETSSTESGGDKAQWIRQGLKRIKELFPRVKGVVWFNVQKECDWRIDSSEEALQAFRETVQSF